MNATQLFAAKRCIPKVFFAAVAWSAVAWSAVAPAHAATATYVAPASISNGEINSLSTAGDGAGFFLGLGQTLALVFDAPFATTRNSNVSIFTLPPAGGLALFEYRFGVYRSGDPDFIQGRNLRLAGFGGDVNNLFQRGCRAFGGCNYVEITLIAGTPGVAGAEVDYVAVDGEVTEVTSPTPEPSVWALAIVGFGLTGWRMKMIRRRLHPDREGWRCGQAEMIPR